MIITNTITLPGIFAGPIIALLSSMYFRRVDDKRDVRKTCAYLAQHLDEFAYECAENISDNELFSDSRGAAGAQTMGVPLLKDWPESTDLRLVEPEILSRLLALKLKRSLSDRRVRFWWDVTGDQDLLPVETGQQCGVLGSEALELATALRRYAHLPEPKYAKFHWDISEVLNSQRERALNAILEMRDPN